jgi:2-dehydropantoate 2-reductase
MRILVLGAGAIGGYMGGRLAEGGADVTFLVRSKRRELLERQGLVVKSEVGDIKRPVKTVLSEEIKAPYDLIIVAAKAYDLDTAIDAIAPAMGPNSVVIPLLNGLLHLDRLVDRFGRERVLGGTCYIGAALSPEGHILHNGTMAIVTFGELDGRSSTRSEKIAAELRKGNFKTVLSDHIRRDMWDKFVVLATLAAVTTVTRASVGEILSTGEGERTLLTALAECTQVAAASGSPLSAEVQERARKMFSDRTSTFTASMRHDLETGGATEADHILGDMVRGGDAKGVPTPTLRLALCNLQLHELRRKR